ncbi:MAG: HIT domain-containing protein [Candidatus Omnitrophica bacterium]|nr:HIT domain-containing protein [Candidatus Omnitrophota bacterium]
MKRLWAPWRKAYITKHKREKGCLFCLKYRSKNDAKNLILERSRHSFSILNLYPYQNGHVMVVPVRHVSRLAELNDRELLDLMHLVNRAQAEIERVMNPDGLNVGINFGKAGGAGVLGHIHIHLVPRWTGDHNFMPVISGTKVISESLESVYERLRHARQSPARRARK